jgi:imidazolonepropionase-like amidohydrolase
LKVLAAGPDEVRRIVLNLLQAGVDLIKVMATGGVFGADENLNTLELGTAELGAAVAAAHGAGRKVAAHACTPEGIANAIRAGADTIEHASFLDESTARLAAAHETIIVPTLIVYRRYVELGTQAGISRRSVEKATDAVAAGYSAIGYALAHGVAVAAGSDAGGRGKPHGWLARELECLVETGLTATQALAAATSIAARACGLTDAGVIAPRYRADIIGTNADPTDDVATLRDVRTVIAAGRLVKPDAGGLRACWLG